MKRNKTEPSKGSYLYYEWLRTTLDNGHNIKGIPINLFCIAPTIQILCYFMKGNDNYVMRLNYHVFGIRYDSDVKVCLGRCFH